MGRINAGLKRRGLTTWFDSDRMARRRPALPPRLCPLSVRSRSPSLFPSLSALCPHLSPLSRSARSICPPHSLQEGLPVRSPLSALHVRYPCLLSLSALFDPPLSPLPALPRCVQEGNIIDKMTSGIDESAVIAVFITKRCAPPTHDAPPTIRSTTRLCVQPAFVMGIRVRVYSFSRNPKPETENRFAAYP